MRYYSVSGHTWRTLPYVMYYPYVKCLGCKCNFTYLLLF